MKSLLMLIFGFVFSLSTLSLVTQEAIAQGPICDQDVPYMTLLPHPNSIDPQYEAELDYLYKPTVYRHLTCGSNDVIIVRPCDPWVCTFYIALWEQGNDQVKLLDPVWNWDTTICQDIRFEVVFPANYIAGNYYDSIVLKTTMIPHASDTCQIVPWYHCLNVPGPSGLIAPECWNMCMHERITYEAIDSCEVPNSAICRIEFDKPLPVELASFTSVVMDNDVILNWTTSIEENNSGFYVERYDNGMWKELGFVVGKGNSTTNTEYTYTDRDLNTGLYGYRLRQVDFNGNFEYMDLAGVVALGTPEKFMLSQNYPNPFNPTTTIVYGIPNNGPVTLKVYDNLGREVRTLVNEPKTAGFYTLTFSAPDLSSGVYFYKLESGNFVTVKRMILMK